MKLRNSNVLLVTSVITVLAVGIYTTANYLFPTTDDDSSALTYGSNTDISFTFDPKLSIATSTDSLTIDNLVPGTTSDSNKVSVTVSSNTPYGYVLSAGVGSTVSTDPYYNTSDLVHDNTTTTVPTTNKFSSISTTASLESLNTDNTWGYSTSTDGGTSWSTYSGLSNTATKPLLDITNPATPSTIDFKIAARSAATQASGTYNNVITFYAVGKPRPPYMQETERIKSQLVNIGDEMQAIDQRDGKKYWVTKLADGNIWMTQNLDLDIIAGKTYTPADTDISTNWAPTNGSIDISNRPPSDWLNSNNVPSSANPGNVYYYSSGDANKDSKYSSLESCQEEHSDCSNKNHVGNYYNWPAAVASNDASNAITKYDNMTTSICPAGWRLPKNANAQSNINGNEQIALIDSYNDILGSYTNDYYMGGIYRYTDSGFNTIRIAPLWLIRSGAVWASSLFDSGQHGVYWSSTIRSAYDAFSFGFNSVAIYTNSNSSKYMGCSIRCLIR